MCDREALNRARASTSSEATCNFEGKLNKQKRLVSTQLSINYHAPGHYDDLLEIETTLIQKPAVKIEFSYTIYNQENKRLVTAQTTLAFVDKKTGKIRQAPDYLLESIDKNMKS